MAWSKVKNIVILILLMMNLVLAGFSVNRMMQARQTRTQARAEAIAFLQSREIQLDESEIPREMELTPMVVSRDVKQEAALAAALLEGEVTVEARGAEVYRYSNQNGFIQFHSNGDFSAHFTPDAMQVGEQSIQAHSKQIMARLGIQGNADPAVTVREDGTKTVNFQEQWDGVTLMNCQVSLNYADGALVSITNGKRLVGTPAALSGANAGTVATALMRFYNGVSAMGDAYSEIREITPGYLLTSTIGESMPLSPVWCIQTDVRAYQLDLQTGALSRIS